MIEMYIELFETYNETGSYYARNNKLKTNSKN